MTHPLPVTVYGCDVHEAALIREVAPRFGISPTLTTSPVSGSTVDLARGSRSVSVGHKSRLTPDHLDALRAVGVEYISTRSIGLDHLDVDHARAIGLVVENTPYSPDSVADYTLMLMLMAVRNAREVLLRVHEHDYRLQDSRGRELRDLTVGIIGTGRIGAAVIDRLRGFGARVIAYDPRPKAHVDYVTLDELFAASDIVTLHAPLDDATRHLVNREHLARMRPCSYIVNTGRGELIDTEALVEALEEGRLAGAALDVVEGENGLFYAEPAHAPSELLRRLHSLPNAVVTPHMAYFTDHALRDVVVNSLARCLRYERTVS
jgi:D-specific alpha-keto acid dehydrogenase